MGFGSPTFGWSDVLGSQLIVNELPVYPKGMLIEPFCHVLADVINAEIQKAASIREKAALVRISDRVSRQPLSRLNQARPGKSEVIDFDPRHERSSLPTASAL